MSINFDLKANIRENLGSSESRRVRRSGGIPAVIYDKKNNTHVSVCSNQFGKEYIKGNIFTTLINLDVVGKNQKVIINKIDLDPVTDKPSHITFTKVEDGSKVKAKVKVRFFNREKSPGLRKGGFLHIVTRKIELLCPTDTIPAEITIDIGKMRVGHKVRSTDITLPENISFVEKKEFNIGSIIGRGMKETEEDKAEAAEVESAAEGGEEGAEEGDTPSEGDDKASTENKEESKEEDKK